jgi:hypothetical protein
MIHYQLRCDQAHEFDGWFKDSAAFEMQARRSLLECPECGSAEVSRALMAPSVPRKANARAEIVAAPEPQPPAQPPAQQPAATPPQMAVDPARMPAQLRAMLQKLRAEVEKNCDYVGEGFADEARRIHRGESDRRGIYGEASPEQAEQLREDGIEIARLPWVPRADG